MVNEATCVFHVNKFFNVCFKVDLEATGNVNLNLQGSGFRLYPHIHGTGGKKFLEYVTGCLLIQKALPDRNKQGCRVNILSLK